MKTRLSESEQAMKPITEQDIASHPFQLQRLGLVMEPEPGNPMEAEGVLNPASARARDWHLLSLSSVGGAGQLLANWHRAGALERGRRPGGCRARWQQAELLRETSRVTGVDP